VAPLDVGDAALGNEAPDVADVDAEVVGKVDDGEQVGELACWVVVMATPSMVGCG
jgi:hypothetical protein